MTIDRVLRLFELPLLTKELNEQAERRRTYLVRFVYASVLFAVACGIFYGNFLTGETRSGSLGQGRFMFERLVEFQFWGICLFLPALASGAFTVEKERNSLGLLMITTLTPWQIVLQKLLSRLVPMFMFLLLSLPLMAVAFSFGGVTEDHLWSGILLLVLTCVQVGSLALMCSAFCRTTAEAFVASYVVFAVLFKMFPIGWAPFLFERAAENSLVVTLMSTLFMQSMTGLFLFFARVFLETRAFVPPRNMVLEFFKFLDARFTEANKVTGGIVLVKDGDMLPGDEPVAWRETTKKSLGTFRYLFRVLVVLELPILLACQLIRFPSPGMSPGLNGMTALLYALWGIAGMMIAVHAASVISSERSRQTLDVLLTTPLSGREILVQKFRGVRRLIRVLLVPFLTIFVFEAWWNQERRVEYVVESLVIVGIYLPLAAWLSMWIGLTLRSQMKAILTSLSLIAGWVLLPIAARYLVSDLLSIESTSHARFLMTLSPATLIPAIEARKSDPATLPDPLWLCCLINFAVYGPLLVLFRRLCLKDADAHLGRS